VKPTGRYGDENIVGNQYPLEFLAYSMRDPAGHTLITAIVADMPSEEDRSGVEVGFLATLAGFAVRGAIAQSGFKREGSK
jgi:hypothetical protein